MIFRLTLRSKKKLQNRSRRRETRHILRQLRTVRFTSDENIIIGQILLTDPFLSFRCFNFVLFSKNGSRRTRRVPAWLFRILERTNYSRDKYLIINGRPDIGRLSSRREKKICLQRLFPKIFIILMTRL